ncbi:type VI secretion system protein TssA [Sinorhizobium americanum]|uniref:type VI secretion system protein TssA n=1 Tax=Sinorhizobium americanum TaxID=194963 RepID=UPI0009352201|nr:type VI secretion system protein TssA [Sinorhizobium americanum]
MSNRNIVAALEENAPCGENLRVSAAGKEIYFRIKDARNAARAAERGIVPGEKLGLSPAWVDVSNLGVQILSSMSKDLEVLAWLAESQLRLHGFRGLGEIYAATAALMRNHWERLHSIGAEPEERFAPLAGLNGIGSEGTIIQALRLVPLVPGGKFGQFSLWDFQLSLRSGEGERREELQEAVDRAGREAMAAHLADLEQCIAAFDQLTALLDERLGDAAPPSSNTRNVLLEAAAAIRTLAAIEAAAVHPAVEEAAVPAVGQQPIDVGAARRNGITSREEAFELLLTVARYFRKSEPHSPISLAIETLVRRGRMDFSELLAELLPEKNTRNSVLTAAGIQPRAEGS